MSGQGLEILTLAEMARCEAAAVASGVSIEALMERAGEAAARAALERFEPARVTVLCGPGNNGGDGYVAARLIAQAGIDVAIEALAPPASQAARAAADKWKGAISSLGARSLQCDLVIDALFGSGLNRPLAGAAAELAAKIASAGIAVLAVDAPSGLSGDLGRPLGEACFRADLTVSFHRRKLAHVLEPARSFCGEVCIADIGLGSTTSRLFENRPSLWMSQFPWPARDAHKHDRGRLFVVSGGPWTTGAARLAARAGLRSGAGLVTVLSPPEALAVNAAHLEAVMLKCFSSSEELGRAAAGVDAAVIGPAAGVGEETRDNLLALAAGGAKLVVDADALTSFADEPARLFAALDCEDVLTPHPGEFERVFPGLLRGASERVSAAREAAAMSGAVVLLKGPDTVIAAPDGRAAVSLNGTPWLATAGSGDVLGGLIGGLLAQGMASFEAACAAAFIHAEAARRFGPGLVSEDLPGATVKVMKRLWRESRPSPRLKRIPNETRSFNSRRRGPRPRPDERARPGKGAAPSSSSPSSSSS
ncbi:MAG: NAD(P)H-hydrate dehydratase [Caulobacteraceae bacterium]